MERQRYLEIAVSLGSLAVVAQALLGSFSFDTREKIRSRDKACVETGGTRHLECAHWNHDKRYEKYDDESNGRLLTAREHYLDHFYRRDNGLSNKDNEFAVQTIWERLTKNERRGLPHPNKYRALAKH